uniref:E3 ubiquitin-protein ligase n=1 Tax=Acrobeloides nanus TaxID=290746 RepID=A0A914D0J8_9BILA
MEHQLMESEWETAFNIFIRMEDTLSMFIAWAKTDAKVHYEIVKKCLYEMELYTSHMPEFSNHVNVEVNGYSANCINFDVSKNVLSIHQPIWRFLAGLFTASPDILANYIVKETKDSDSSSALNALNTHVNLKDKHAMLLEMPLRVLVLYAQTHAQLWRRNGFSLINQIHNYNSPLCRFEMYDRDVLMLQVVAALSDPTSFLIRLYDRFGLAKWAQLGSEDLPLPTLTANTPTVPSATPEELSKITVLIAEEMLHLLIIILSERYIPGVGKNVTFMDSLKREIIHLLCSGPKPFSFIER